MQRFPDIFEFSVSATTRQQRPGESDGDHYWFISTEEFQRQVDAGKFLEYAEVHRNMYGTSFETLENIKSRGKVCLLDIDVQGALQIYGKGLEFNSIFIVPPSMTELERRLKIRRTEDDATIARRLANAGQEIQTAKDHPEIFKEFVVNEDLETAVEEFCVKVAGLYGL